MHLDRQLRENSGF